MQKHLVSNQYFFWIGFWRIEGVESLTGELARETIVFVFVEEFSEFFRLLKLIKRHLAVRSHSVYRGSCLSTACYSSRRSRLGGV